MRRGAQAVTVAVVLALLGVLVWDTAHSQTGKIAREVDKRHVVNAWFFTRPRVDTKGMLSLASLKGKVVVLNFWQSYCAPCTHEAPIVSAASKRWAGKNVVFVGVDEQDLRGPALKFIKRFEIDYPIISDAGPLVGHYGVTGYPETFFIDRHGRVVPPHIVGPATRQTLDQGIRNALKT
jgi:cytochrome c biogenesis protein CcmG, thiol:disulfide interchange protein DsbE